MGRAGEENRERLARLYEHWAKGEFWADTEIYDPDVEVVWAEGMVDSTVDHGIEELSSTMRGFMEGFTGIRMTAEQIVSKGDRCLVWVDWHGTGRATEIPFHRRVFHLWTFSGDRAVRIEGLWEEEEARQAAGIETDEAGLSGDEA